MNLLKEVLKPDTERVHRDKALDSARKAMEKFADAIKTIDELQGLIDGPQVEYENFKTISATSEPIKGMEDYRLQLIIDLVGNPLSAKLIPEDK